MRDIFPGGGELGERLRAFDWSQTPAGPVGTWPQSLRTAIRILLNSRYPMFVWWGPDLTTFYNDAYVPVLGAKHPAALGRRGDEVWAEIWDVLGPFKESVFDRAEANYSEALLLVMERHGFREETYFTFSYSPILEEDGRVGGLFCACTEDTARVIGERRLRALRELAERTGDARRVEEAVASATACLAGRQHDLPFALFYLLDESGRTAHRAGGAGLEPGAEAAPPTVHLDEPATDPWGLGRVHESGEARLVDDLARRVRGLPRAPWDEPPRAALVLPMSRAGQERLAGFCVLGLSPRLAFDADYRAFCELVAAQVASAIANARAYEDERRRAEALAELDRAKTVFFGNVSHEFRTPLTLMLGPLEDALGGDEALGPRNRQRLTVAHRNSLRLLKLVNTMLDFSRIEAGRIEAAYEEVDLAQYTGELASSFRSAIERAGLEFAVHTEAVGAPVWVDREMWEKIVLNLVSNAFKFTIAGRIEVSLRRVDDDVELRVADTGCGIPAAELDRVFERFHRVRGATARTQEGTGIGLALVRELVRFHGGTVGVESSEGGGTTFTVAVPTGSAHLPPDRLHTGRGRRSAALAAVPFVEEALRWLPDAGPGVDELPGATRSSGVSTAGARLVLADDNADMREYLRRLLAEHWTVEAVPDGEAALAAIRASPPALVLTDVMMPKLDGFGLLRAVRNDARTRTIPVVLLSARAGEESRVEGLDAGADDYLVKPFSARELVARVNAQLAMAAIRDGARRAVAESEARLLLALGAARMVAWTWDFATDRVDYMGDVDAFYGTVPGALAPRAADTLRLVHPDDLPAVNAAIDEAKRTGGEYRFEFRLLRPPPREPFVVEVIGRVRCDASGVAVSADGIVANVNARRQAEREREELLAAAEAARAEAEQANRAKDTFLAVLSHELRSPLNAMLGWIRILGNPDVSAATAARAVETLERNVWVQAQVVSDLLDVSRIASGKLDLDLQLVDVSMLVAHCVESARPSADGKRLRLEVASTPEPAMVHADPARLQQVIGNLLSNAIKFTPEGGAIAVAVRSDGGTVAISVRDSGQGIEPTFLPFVFDPFRQADASTARRHGGLGLGLAIVRLLTERLGGRVRADSGGPDRGATFTVTLPLAAPSADGRPAVTPAAAPAAEGPSERIDVLVVEDDADTREALALALAGAGVGVRVAGSVGDALALYGERRPDVLVSDIGMPGDDGYVLIRAIREREEGGRQRTPAIAMTGFATRQDHATALRAGFDEHLGKPVAPDTLLERVRVLAAARATRPRVPGFS